MDRPVKGRRRWVEISAADPMPFLKFTAELREETAHARTVEWHARVNGEIDLRPLYHLCPPLTPSSAVVTPWQASFQPGQRYYRRGPGFVVIYDKRPGALHHELILSAPEEVAVFDRLHAPSVVSADDRIVMALRTAGVVFVLGEMAVMPVGRLRRLILPRNMM